MPTLEDVLAEDEPPSTFGSLFRFIGRPGFMFRNLLMGDFEGFARNVGQMGQEFLTGAFLNQNLSITGLLGYRRDITSAAQRPEFTDLLTKWGVVNKYALPESSKLALDMVGGFFTDPLSLLGGGAKSAGNLGLKLAAGGIEARGALATGIRTAGSAAQRLALESGTAARLESFGARAGRAGGLRRALAGAPGATAEERIGALAEGGAFPRFTPERAQRLIRGVEGNVAQDMFFENLRKAGAKLDRAGKLMPTPASLEGIGAWNLGVHAPQDFEGFMRGSQRFTFVPESAVGSAPTEIRQGLSTAVQNYKKIDTNVLGRPMSLVYKPGDESVARGAEALFRSVENVGKPGQTAASLQNAMGRSLTDGFRVLGIHDDWIKTFLKTNLPEANSEALVKNLGQINRLTLETPSNVLDEGMKLLLKEGMAPSSGLTVRSLPFGIGESALKSVADRAGWQFTQGRAYIPWGSIGGFTAPGLARKGLQLAGVDTANTVDKFAANLWDWTVKHFDRFLPSKALPGTKAMTSKAREVYYNRQGAIQGHANDLNRIVMERFSPVEQQIKTNLFLGTEEVYQQYQNALGKTLPEIDALWAKPPAIDGILDLGKTLDSVAAMKESGGDFRAFFKTAVPQLKELQSAIDILPHNPSLERKALGELVSGSDSVVPVVRRAARKAASVLREWDKFDGEALAARTQLRGVMKQLDVALAVETQARAARGVVEGGLEGKDFSLTAWRTLQEERAWLVKQTSTLASQHESLQASARAAMDPAARAEFLSKAADLEKLVSGGRQAHKELSKEIVKAGARLNRRGGGPEAWKIALDNLDGSVSRAADEVLKREEAGVLGKGKFLDDMLRTNKGMLQQVEASRDVFVAKSLWDKMLNDSVTQIGALRKLRTPEEFSVLRQHLTESFGLVQKKLETIPVFMRTVAKNEDDLLRGATKAKASWEWHKNNPFYLPHQVDTRLFDMLHDGTADKNMRIKIDDAFTRRRTYPTISEFRKALTNLADELGIPDEGSEDLVEGSFGALAFKRLVAFEHTKARQLLFQHAREVAKAKGGDWDTYTKWVRGVLSPVGPRQGLFLKLLGGGDFSIPDAAFTISDETIKKLNKLTDNPSFMRAVEKNGIRSVKLRWPGANYLYKPLLTSVPWNLRYHVRNVIAMPFMASFHPEMTLGDGSVTQARKAMLNSGLVRWVTNHLNDWTGTKIPEWGDPESALKLLPKGQRKDLATTWIVRALLAQGGEREAAWNVLERLNDKVGRYTWKEVRGGIEKFLGQPMTSADLLSGEQVEKLLTGAIAGRTETPAGAGILARTLKKAIEFGEKMAGEAEYRFRSRAFLNLLEKGYTIDDAIEQIQRTFVDYSRQTTVERAIRDIVPFSRFMIGSAAWAKGMAENPAGRGLNPFGASRLGSLTTLGTAQRSLQGGPGEVPVLPEGAGESIALPLPWRDKEGNRQFIVSLGLPQETTIQLLSVLGLRPEVIRQRILGASQPLLKASGEAITGHSFYFGTDWGSYRKAPAFLRGVGLASETAPGRYEVPGWVNELTNALPLAGLDSTINRATDPRSPVGSKLVNAFTGVRTQSVDTEYELQKRIVEFMKDKEQAGQVGKLETFFSKVPPEQTPAEIRVVLQAIQRERAQRKRKS